MSSKQNCPQDQYLCKIIEENILPYFSWQKGKEVEISFAVVKNRTGLSEKKLGALGDYQVDYCGEKVPLKELMYDPFVREASSLARIAKILRMNSYQRAQHYLQATRQYSQWRRQRQLQQESSQQSEILEAEVRQGIGNLLLTKVLHDSKDNWPLQTALLVDLRKARSSTRIPIACLEKLFSYYERAVADNKPLGLNTFSDITGLSPNDISRQLQLAELKAMNPNSRKGWRKKKVCLSPAQIKRIKRSKNTFPRSDLSFFLGLPYWVLDSRLPSLCNRREIRREIRPAIGPEIARFSYRLASEIYQAKDHFAPTDIQYALGLDGLTYEKYLKYQGQISLEIIQNLRQIYPELADKITQPYLTPQIRQLQSSETMEAVVLRALDKAIKKGARSMNELEQETGFDDATIERHAARKHIKLPLQKGRKCKKGKR